MEKVFNEWNALKQEINRRSTNQIKPQEREVWMCSIGKNVGFEQDAVNQQFSRPVLVVKKFNNNMVWVVPLTTHQKTLDFYYNFTDLDNRRVSAITAQLKLQSTKRFIRIMYRISEHHFLGIRDQLVKHLLTGKN